MANEVTFTPEALKAVIAQAVAEALAARDTKQVPKNTSVDAKTDAALKMDVLVCRAFKRSGFGEVRPRIDVQTYNRWLSQGLKVRAGERCTKVRQFRLFHRSQCEPVAEQSKAEMQAEADAAVAAHAAKPATVVQSIAAKLKGKTSAPAQASPGV